MGGHWESVLLAAYSVADTFLTMGKGLLADKVMTRGFGEIDQFETLEYLQKHGQKSETLANAFLVAGSVTSTEPQRIAASVRRVSCTTQCRCLCSAASTSYGCRYRYDLIFGYRGGSPKQPMCAAGVAIHDLLNMFLNVRPRPY